MIWLSWGYYHTLNFMFAGYGVDGIYVYSRQTSRIHSTINAMPVFYMPQFKEVA